MTIDQPGDADSNPIENATVHVYGVDNPRLRVASTATAADGTYTVDGLAPGDYYVEAVAIGYLTERFDDVGLGEMLATTVSVAENITTTSIDLALEPQGVISGVATAEAGAYVGSTDMYCVAATPLAPLSFPARTSCARIGQPYRISKLPSGSYDVQFTSANFRTTPYTDVGGIPTPVTVTTPLATSGIDATLIQKPVISGTLTGSDGAPVDRGPLALFRSDGSYVGEYPHQVGRHLLLRCRPRQLPRVRIRKPGICRPGIRARVLRRCDDARRGDGGQRRCGQRSHGRRLHPAATPEHQRDDDTVRVTPRRSRPTISRSFYGQTTCDGDSGTFEIFVQPGSYLVSFSPNQQSFAVNGGTGPPIAQAQRPSPSITAATPPVWL